MTKQIKKILDSDNCIEVKKLLIKRCEELKDISNIQKCPNSEIAVEARAQIKAYKKLREIIEEFLSYEEENIDIIEDDCISYFK